jgi:hypothetical protein
MNQLVAFTSPLGLVDAAGEQACARFWRPLMRGNGNAGGAPRRMLLGAI